MRRRRVSANRRWRERGGVRCGLARRCPAPVVWSSLTRSSMSSLLMWWCGTMAPKGWGTDGATIRHGDHSSITTAHQLLTAR